MKKEKKEKKQKQKTKKGMSIIKQISIAFIIPILFVILVGILSYMQAEKGLRENYEESALATLNATNQYMTLGLQLVEAEAIKYACDTNMNEYYMGLYENNNAKKSQTISSMQSSMKSAKATNKFIENIHIVTRSDVTMQTTKQIQSGTGTSIYEEFLSELENTYGSNINAAWLEYHNLLDEKLKLSSQDYILSYYCTSNNSQAAVLVDVSTETIMNALSAMDMGNGSTVGFITKEGREIVSGNDTGFSLAGKNYYADFLASEAPTITTYVYENSQEYLLLASKTTLASSVIYALVPKNAVVEKAAGIKLITILLVLLSCLIAVIIAFLISAKISRRMKLISTGLNSASEGNLTTRIKMKGTDEFTSIGENINHMITNMNMLVRDSKQNVSRVSETVQEVTNTSGIVNSHSENINHAIEEINSGIIRQAENAKECQQKMDTLSDEIKTMVKEVEKIETYAASSHDMIVSGVQQMNSLSAGSSSTNQVIDQVMDNISNLSEKTKAIEEFINIINDISSQTNLLSLNASIEAARAGTFGRGFAVVAEEIRHLADSSLQAADQIRATVKDIRSHVEETTLSAGNAAQIISRQNATINSMNAIFDQMSLGMAELLSSVDEISSNIEKVDFNRHSTKLAVEQITEVIHTTSSFSSKVSLLANELLENVEKMNAISDQLMKGTHELQSEMEHFIID